MLGCKRDCANIFFQENPRCNSAEVSSWLFFWVPVLPLDKRLPRTSAEALPGVTHRNASSQVLAPPPKPSLFFVPFSMRLENGIKGSFIAASAGVGVRLAACRDLSHFHHAAQRILEVISTFGFHAARSRFTPAIKLRCRRQAGRLTISPLLFIFPE